MLYEPAFALKTASFKWTIRAHDATLLLSGVAEGEAGVVSATNSTAIDLKYSYFLVSGERTAS
jgi:hypothetical protein